MSPPTIWPTRPAREMVNPFGIGGNDAVRKVVETDNMLKRPWKVTVASGVVDDWHNMMLVTVLEAIRTLRRRRFLLGLRECTGSLACFWNQVGGLWAAELLRLKLHQRHVWALGLVCIHHHCGSRHLRSAVLLLTCCWWWYLVWESVGTWWKGWENGYWRWWNLLPWKSSLV